MVTFSIKCRFNFIRDFVLKVNKNTLSLLVGLRSVLFGPGRFLSYQDRSVVNLRSSHGRSMVGPSLVFTSFVA